MIPFYLDVDTATHQANFDANTAANLRLVALTMRDSGGSTLYSAAWVPSDGRGWVACHGFSETQLLQFYSNWQAQGFEMKLVTSSETVFGAIMEATKTGTQFVYDLTDGPTSSSGGTAPTWATTFGAAAVADGTTGLTWMVASIGAPAAWASAKAYAQGALVTDSNGNLQQALTAGTSGTTAPAWEATFAEPPVSDGASGLMWSLISFGLPPAWAGGQTYTQGALVTDSSGNLQRAATANTLANALNSNQQPFCNLAPRAIAMYGAPGATRRYALVFEPCRENWANSYFDTDAVATETISAFFNDLRYRPTLLAYNPEGGIFTVFRDNSIGTNNWTTGNGQSPSALTATYTSFTDRGLFPLYLSVNPGNDTFAFVMVTNETPLARQFSVEGSDIANLAGTIDPLVQSLMQSGRWNSVGQPRVISVAIAYKQRLMFAKAYTWADPTYPIATPISQFRMASCSKPITSTAIGRLLQDGLLNDTDTVTNIGLTPTPGGGAFPAGFDSINVIELRSHRTGLQPVGNTDQNIAAAYGHPTPISIYEDAAYSLTGATISVNNWNGAFAGFPSTTTLQVWYMNINYQLLGLMVRAATSGLYTSYVQGKIFSPLGLTRPCVGASLHSQRATLEVQHHSSYPSGVGPNAVTTDPAYVGGGYGTGDSENFEGFEDWSISSVDYAALLSAVGVANPGNYPVLNSTSIATMFTKIDPTGVQDNFTLGGLFWETSNAGVTVFAHDGGWSVGGLNIASWVITRTDGVSATVFMNMDDSGAFGNFAWGLGSNQLQGILDAIESWPSTGDLFPSFGIPALAILVIVTTAVAPGIVGTRYSATVIVSGGNPSYNLSVSSGSLPNGLGINRTSGVISGTPLGPAGTANFAVQVTDSSNPAQTATVNLSITINVALTIAIPLPQGLVGTLYNAASVASGGNPPYTFSISSGSLPAGIGINSTTGVITGAPLGPAGTANFTVEVTDSSNPAQTATEILSITVNAPLAISTTTLPAATKGTVYSATVIANGGNAPYNFSVSSGSLPNGLAINPASGVISGTPTGHRGTASFTVQVTDSSSPAQTATANLSIKVS